jgi:hypothetical protein
VTAAGVTGAEMKKRVVGLSALLIMTTRYTDANDLAEKASSPRHGVVCDGNLGIAGTGVTSTIEALNMAIRYRAERSEPFCRRAK